MLITFSGLDGAGKSTLITWLTATLEQRNRPAAVFHMYDDVGLYAYLRAARDWLTGLAHHARALAHVGGQRSSSRPDTDGAHTPGGAGQRLHSRIARAIVWDKRLRRLIYPLDLLVFLVYRLYVERLTNRILIMDRYFYDVLVDVADDAGWHWLRWLARITPTPTVPVYLDVTPEESYARKGEYTVPYLRNRRVAYKEVFRWLPSAVAIDNHDLSTTKAELERVVLERLAAP